MLFIFAELGTTGNMDAGGQLILKGKVVYQIFIAQFSLILNKFLLLHVLIVYFSSSKQRRWKRF